VNAVPFIKNGSLGAAYRNIFRAYGIKIASQGFKEGEYDYTCRKSLGWPAPDVKDTKSRQKVFLKPNTTTGKCEFSAEKTAYNVF